MDRIVTVRFYDLHGAPLIADVETDEEEPYRRRTMGFLAPSERVTHVVSTGGGVLRPPVCSCEQESAEGVFVEIE